MKLTPSGGGLTETILYSFTGGSNGANPCSLLLGNDGNLYGNFIWGGFFSSHPQRVAGLRMLSTLFNPHTMIYFVQDSSGNLYGLGMPAKSFMLSPSNGEWVYAVVDEAYFCDSVISVTRNSKA